ncbi:MAG: hypothetical protein ACP5QG_09065, partial [candidate division WOR-3 bacterium]
SAAEDAMASRFGYGSWTCEHRDQINYVMVETERFMMISRRMSKNLSLLLVLRSPVECLGMPIELIERWEDRILEAIAGSKSHPLS